MDLVAVLTVTGGLLAFGLISRRIRGTPLTGPMLFTGFGVLVGPAVLGWVDVGITHGTLHLLAEVTLIVVLFSDAANIDLRQLRSDHDLPVRMLLVGMPLGIALGAVLARGVLPGLALWEAALLAAILVPTDAALGQAVVTDRAVPVRIRQALNVESGLNDGIALPFVLVLATLASMTAEGADVGHWLTFGARQVTFGPLAGIAVGAIGAKLVALSYRARWMTEEAEGIVALSLAFGAFALAELVDGNGFLAAFVAGLTFGNVLQYRCKFLYEFTDAEGKILILLTFTAFGVVMIPAAAPVVTAGSIVFAVLALTVMRMIPIHLSLLGTGVRPVTSAFLGWFGPRGLASVLFVLLILEEAAVEHREAVSAAVTVTVALSVLLHGITAGPGARWYGARAHAMGEAEETRPVGELPFPDSARPASRRA